MPGAGARSDIRVVRATSTSDLRRLPTRRSDTHVARADRQPRGAIGVAGHEIALAKHHAGNPTVVFRTSLHVVVFIGDQHIRTLDIDHTRHYQPSGIKPPGRPPTTPP